MHSTGDRRSGQRQVAEAVAARLGREARKWNAADIIKTVRTNRWRGINARIRSAIARPVRFSTPVVQVTLNMLTGTEKWPKVTHWISSKKITTCSTSRYIGTGLTHKHENVFQRVVK